MFISTDNLKELIFTYSMKGNENSINSGGHYKQNIINDNNRHISDSGRFTCPDDTTWEQCVRITDAPLNMHIYRTIFS